MVRGYSYAAQGSFEAAEDDLNTHADGNVEARVIARLVKALARRLKPARNPLQLNAVGGDLIVTSRQQLGDDFSWLYCDAVCRACPTQRPLLLLLRHNFCRESFERFLGHRPGVVR